MYSSKVAQPNKPYALTENFALAYADSQSGCVDLFSKALRDISQTQMKQLLDNSWKESQLDTVKLIFYKRDCRGGSGEKRLFYWAYQWLMEVDLDTARLNILNIPEYGTYKDLLQIFLGSALEQDMLDTYSKQLIHDHYLMTQSDEQQQEKCGDGEEDSMDCERNQQNKQKGKRKATLSLAAKWSPTENGHFDKKHKAVQKLSKTMKVGVRKYRKNYVTPLRAYLEVVERLMCGNQWDKIDYSHVPSVAMMKLRKAFLKHDREGFQTYLLDVKEGKKKINAGQLFPHQLVGHYLNYSAQQDDVIDEQWKALVAKTKELGKLNRCLALCDVSGSMMGTPMEVSIALGLMISEIVEEPFKNLVITFDVIPQFFEVTGTTLMEKARQIQRMPWGGNTNIQVAFDKILERAQQYNLPQEHMPNTLFILSDMQFDEASDGNYETNYQAMQRKFTNAGYDVPQVVFWNLRGEPSNQPVTQDERGVALVSGFSPSLLKLFTEGVIESPYDTMRKAIDDPRYHNIKLASKTGT